VNALGGFSGVGRIFDPNNTENNITARNVSLVGTDGIDADLRKPSLHKIFQTASRSKGLTSVLTGLEKLQDEPLVFDHAMIINDYLHYRKTKL